MSSTGMFDDWSNAALRQCGGLTLHQIAQSSGSDASYDAGIATYVRTCRCHRASIEQAFRGGDAAADWILVISGFGAGAVEQVISAMPPHADAGSLQTSPL